MSQYLSAALEAISSVQELVVQGQSHLQAITAKADNSVVTEIDTQVEQQLKEFLTQKFPDHGFFGEEFGGGDEREYTWIVDPIDGTREYSRGLPLFSTFLALKKGDEFIVGVSLAPAFEQTFWAEKGEGAYCNGQRLHVSKISTLKEAFVLGSAYKYLARSGTFPAMARLAEDVRGTRNVGAFGYQWVAAGHAEVSIEVGTNIYDVAPFAVIIPEAGGAFTALDGGPISLSTKDFVASNGVLHERILEYFQA